MQIETEQVPTAVRVTITASPEELMALANYVEQHGSWASDCGGPEAELLYHALVEEAACR